MERKNSAVVAIAVVPALVIGGILGMVLMTAEDEGCVAAGGGASGISIDPASVPQTSIAGYGAEQLTNAAYIMAAGKALGLSARDQAIGVMTAMGESSLRSIDYGDWETGGVTNPDGTRTTSIGLFQQQDGWGTREERLDPYTTSTKFFEAMIAKVPDRDSLEPTIVAHRTQVNSDPYHYTKYWAAAVEVVDGLAGTRTGLSGADGTASGTCQAVLPGTVNANGWASPGEGPLRDLFGMRQHPVYGTWSMHSGIDLAAGGCEGPIWAANSGTVTFRGFDNRGNGTITVDHGGGVLTSYLHSYDSGMLVQVGDTVQAGQQIARTGSSGESTGCHLHFSVTLNGQRIDPLPFMSAVGIKLGE